MSPQAIFKAGSFQSLQLLVNFKVYFTSFTLAIKETMKLPIKFIMIHGVLEKKDGWLCHLGWHWDDFTVILGRCGDERARHWVILSIVAEVY